MKTMQTNFKVVGTSSLSSVLQEKTATCEDFKMASGASCVQALDINGEIYLLDTKSVHFTGSKALVHGLISDDKSFVAKVTLEFKQ